MDSETSPLPLFRFRHSFTVSWL